MKRATLQSGNTFGCQLAAAIDQAGVLGAVLHGFAWNLVVVSLVGLAQIGGVSVRNGAFVTHPVQRGARVQTAGKRDAYFLAGGDILKNGGHRA